MQIGDRTSGSPRDGVADSVDASESFVQLYTNMSCASLQLQHNHSKRDVVIRSRITAKQSRRIKKHFTAFQASIGLFLQVVAYRNSFVFLSNSIQSLKITFHAMICVGLGMRILLLGI
jgi:hypothetical protein